MHCKASPFVVSVTNHIATVRALAVYAQSLPDATYNEPGSMESVVGKAVTTTTPVEPFSFTVVVLPVGPVSTLDPVPAANVGVVPL